MNRLEWSVRETNLENEVAGGDLELIYTNGNIYIYRLPWKELPREGRVSRSQRSVGNISYELHKIL